MFDDIQQPPAGGGSTPPNLPLGEPEDIFASSDDVPTPMSSDSQVTSSPPLPTALGAGVLKPRQSIDTTPQIQENLSSSPSLSEVATPSFDNTQDVIATHHTESIVNSPTDIGPQEVHIPPDMPVGVTETIHTPPAELFATGQNTSHQSPAPVNMDAFEEKPFGAKNIFIIVSVIIVVSLLGAGSFWIYSSFMRTGGTGSTPPITVLPDTNIITPPVDTVVVPPVVTSTDISEEDRLLFGDPVDTDGDGLTDMNEMLTYGTDPLKADTDGDGLSDGEEVAIWNTDPLNPDSDGDGYSDGQEIRNGYNPIGPGRLFEVPATTTSEPVVTTTE